MCWLVASAAATAQPLPIPPNILAANNLPMVMLSASKDFTMFWKAYTDFDDINADGVIDRTFMPAFKYYGYFDPTKCYNYSSGNKRFEPKRISDANDISSVVSIAVSSERNPPYSTLRNTSMRDMLVQFRKLPLHSLAPAVQ